MFTFLFSDWSLKGKYAITSIEITDKQKQQKTVKVGQICFYEKNLLCACLCARASKCQCAIFYAKQMHFIFMFEQSPTLSQSIRSMINILKRVKGIHKVDS